MHPGKSGKTDQKILVTGHRGYIGSVLLQEMAAAGYRNVTGLDSNLYGLPGPDDSIPGIRQITRDIRDITSDEIKGFDTVIHLAALSNDPLGNLDEGITDDINHVATGNLAEIARKNGTRRFIFASTCSVYGNAAAEKITETTNTNPVTPYARSKLMAEIAISGLASDNFCPVFLRNATVYGVSPGMRFDLVVNNLVASAYLNDEVFLESDGCAWRPLVHVRDVCKAIILMISAPVEQVFNNAFNIGNNNENYQIINIANYIKENNFAREIRFSDSANRDSRTYNVSFDKFAQYFPGNIPCTSMAEGVIEVYNSLRDQRLPISDIFGPRYMRIDCLKKLLQEQLLTETLRWA